MSKRSEVKTAISPASFFGSRNTAFFRIAAWSDPDTDVSDEEAWTEAASAVRTIEAGFEMAVDLTAGRLS